MCLTICATVIISRAAEACSASSAPKSTGIGLHRVQRRVDRAPAARGGATGPPAGRRGRGAGAPRCATAPRSAAHGCAPATGRATPARRAPPRAPARSASSGLGDRGVEQRQQRLGRGHRRVALADQRLRRKPRRSADRRASGTGGDLAATASSACGTRAGSASAPASAATWACSRASCSCFISSRSRSVSHQPISVRPSVS